MQNAKWCSDSTRTFFKGPAQGEGSKQFTGENVFVGPPAQVELNSLQGKNVFVGPPAQAVQAEVNSLQRIMFLSP